jgi:hypothetical protein
MGVSIEITAITWKGFPCYKHRVDNDKLLQWHKTLLELLLTNRIINIFDIRSIFLLYQQTAAVTSKSFEPVLSHMSHIAVAEH